MVAHPSSKSEAPRDFGVAVWLFVVCAFVTAMILVGGATRLTDSGLSITEWNFVKGIIPPLSDSAWNTEFALYQQTAEYQRVNFGMSMADFQGIYLWEWGHRFLGKMIGLVFAIPYLFFLFTGRLKGRLLACTALFALGGLQGAIGWWMVTSGLGQTDRVDVSSIRLAVHLGMAFSIIGFAFYLALLALGWPRQQGGARMPVAFAAGYLALLFAQIVFGALVAGIDAGRAASDWPTIGGEWFPSSYAGLEPFARNLVENALAAQYNHRMLGYAVFLTGLGLSHWAIRAASGPTKTMGMVVTTLLLTQVGLGIATVMTGAPLWLCLIHQGGAIALWLASVSLCVAGLRAPVTVAQTQAAQGVAANA
jgi:cytochrome c oxidase assembly protein subunit 15